MVQNLRTRPWVLVMALASGSSGLLAQPAFSGVTIVQRVYYNCRAGQAACQFDETATDAWDQSLTHVKIQSDRGSKLPDERLIDNPVAHTQSHVIPATNQFFELKLNGLPQPAPDTTGKCAAFIPAGMVASGKKIRLGYRAVSYTGADGWIEDFFPALACVSIHESTPAPGGTTIYELVSITPGFDKTLFAPNPGMVDTLPSQVIHDKTVKYLVSTGKSAAEAEAIWTEQMKMNQTFSMIDAIWKKSHPVN